jgi:hypothetical protein
MAKWSCDTVIRGKEVTVFADAFGEDLSVGINWGPEEVWAEDLHGNNFELTDEEFEDFAIRAAEDTYDDIFSSGPDDY